MHMTSAMNVKSVASIDGSSHSFARALSEVFLVLTIIGVLGTALGMYGAMVMSRAGDIGSVELHALAPAVFNHVIHASLLVAAVGIIGLVRPHEV
jgi:hypothetical protein